MDAPSNPGNLTLPALVRELSETVAHLADRMDQLTQTVIHLSEGQQRLTEGQRRLEVQMGEVRGWTLEQRYHTHAAAYFDGGKGDRRATVAESHWHYAEPAMLAASLVYAAAAQPHKAQANPGRALP